MLDYETLPFITARNPYNELIRPADSLPPEGSVGRSVQFVVYGWGRGSLYSSNTRAFPLDDTLLGRHRAIAAAVLDDDERRRAGVLDLHPERSRRAFTSSASPSSRGSIT